MPSRAHKTILLGLALLATSGCTSTYWSTITNASRVTASLTSPGTIAWTVTKNTQGAITSAKAAWTAPVISLLLDPNSSPVTFSNAQADYYDAAAASDAKGKATRNPLTNLNGDKVGSLYFPFVAQLSIKDRATVPAAQSFTLSGAISQELIDLTDPRSTDSIVVPTVFADVTLRGTNTLGQAITANVQIPINITVL